MPGDPHAVTDAFPGPFRGALAAVKLKMPSLPSFRIRPVRFVLELFGAIVIGVGLGLGSAYLAVENGPSGGFR